MKDRRLSGRANTFCLKFEGKERLNYLKCHLMGVVVVFQVGKNPIRKRSLSLENRRPRRRTHSSLYSVASWAALTRKSDGKSLYPHYRHQVSIRRVIGVVWPAQGTGRRTFLVPRVERRNHLRAFACEASAWHATRAIHPGIRPLATWVSSPRVPSASCASRSAVVPVL